MSITLILNGKQRRKLHLPKQRLAWVGGILFTVLALSGGWLWQSWHQKMEALEVALAMAEQQKSTQGADEAREQLAMLAAQVGTMQGQLGRLNALGERLAKIGKLEDGEFDFAAEPAMGGPETLVSQRALKATDKIHSIDNALNPPVQQASRSFLPKTAKNFRQTQKSA